MPIESVLPCNHIILCRPLLLLSSIFPSIRVFSNESLLPIGWPKYWSSSVSPSNEYSGLISFRMDWLDLFAVRRTLKSLLQYHSSFVHQFFSAHPSVWSNSHMTTGKIITLTIRTFVGKVRSLLFNMLSRFVVAFLPGSKRLLMSWLQSPHTVILEPKEIASVTVSTFSPSVCHEMMRPAAMTLVFWMLSFESAFSLSSFPHLQLVLNKICSYCFKKRKNVALSNT